ncbi:hypothetical protein [Bradyrhizobium sp. SZCCHNS3053]|uniref:hypothetical protein n=1 Tax=Bradyrhizobium sp. SZCCHNS3053 TaxID=3057322 RepID=UPI0029165295|nr:hypothetical protein [Bradyrhizobium sp. SZCCHNS3053]
MPNGSSKRKMRQATSCKQLDFDWRQSSQGSNNRDVMVEIDACTIGPQLSVDPADRLFVPLAASPFNWFQSGQKKWELRRFGRQYTPKHVRVGRRVELRKGYKGPESIWGEVLDVVEANGLDDFFNKVDFKEVIPVASTREDAVQIASDILRVGSSTPLLGFCVVKL